jgi:hypothetical protein
MRGRRSDWISIHKIRCLPVDRNIIVDFSSSEYSFTFQENVPWVFFGKVSSWNL